MKKILFSLIACAVMVGATAQEAAMTDVNSSEQRAHNLALRMKQELDLNEKQLEKVKQIQLEEIQAKENLRKERREEMMEKRKAMAEEREALKENKEALAAQKEELAAKRQAAKEEMSLLEETTKKKMKAVLSDEQYERYLMLLGKKEAKQEMRGTQAKARPVMAPKTK